jgi:hypothetical protein
MSVELDIVCHDCKEAIWGGCDGMSGHQWLSGNPAEMRAIGAFLYRHMGHRLEYVNSQTNEDYKVMGGVCTALTTGAKHVPD